MIPALINITNHNGWTLTLDSKQETYKLIDRWDLPKKPQSVKFVFATLNKKTSEPRFSTLLSRINEIRATNREKFGFTVFQEGGEYYVYFGPYGLAGGGKNSRDTVFATVGTVATAAGAVLAASNPFGWAGFAGYGLAATGISLFAHMWCQVDPKGSPLNGPRMSALPENMRPGYTGPDAFPPPPR